MFRPVRALFWEILWKNRIVAPALVVLFGIGAWMISATIRAHAAGLADQADYYPRSIAFLSFLASLFLIYAPFNLMESQSGWRMNSMITRWFALPVRTWILVAVPLFLGCVCVAIVVGVWWLPLKQYIPLDVLERVLALLFALMAVVQAVAWATPRKPWQFWVCMVLLGYVVLWVLLQHAPKWGKDLESNQVLPDAGIVTLAASFVAYGFALFTRRGTWPGCFQAPKPGGYFHWKRRLPRRLVSVGSALYWSESVPVWRFFGLGWLGIVVLVAIAIGMKFHDGSIALRMGYKFVILMVCYNTLPVLALIWLSPLAIAAGCTSPGVCWTRISPYLAMQPMASGALVQARLLGVFLAWMIVWLPFFIFGPVYQTMQDNPGDLVTSAKIYSMIGWFMVISAHAAIGCLPLFLWGRLEGLPTLILGMLGSCFVTWQLAGWLRGDEERQAALWMVGSLLAVKILVALGLLIYSYRQRQITWKFAVTLPLVWSFIGLILAGLSWRDFGVVRAMAVLIMLPLARPALCPMAVALNRHR
jgi:hypothetical protein